VPDAHQAEISSSVTTTPLTRAADVALLREHRRLVLLVRESPPHLRHLRNILAIAEMRAMAYPPVPALCARPASVEEMIDHNPCRAKDSVDIDRGGRAPLGGVERGPKWRARD